MDEAALAEVVDRAVREALAGRAPPSAPDPDRSLQAAAEGEGLDVIEDVIARGEPTPDDREAVREALRRTDQAGANAILSAWATAINRGDIRIQPGQAPL